MHDFLQINYNLCTFFDSRPRETKSQRAWRRRNIFCCVCTFSFTFSFLFLRKLFYVHPWKCLKYIISLHFFYAYAIIFFTYVTFCRLQVSEGVPSQSRCFPAVISTLWSLRIKLPHCDDREYRTSVHVTGGYLSTCHESRWLIGVSWCKMCTAGCYDVLMGVIKNETGTERVTDTNTVVAIIRVVESWESWVPVSIVVVT